MEAQGYIWFHHVKVSEGKERLTIVYGNDKIAATKMDHDSNAALGCPSALRLFLGTNGGKVHAIRVVLSVLVEATGGQREAQGRETRWESSQMGLRKLLAFHPP